MKFLNDDMRSLPTDIRSGTSRPFRCYLLSLRHRFIWGKQQLPDRELFGRLARLDASLDRSVDTARSCVFVCVSPSFKFN